MEKQTPSGIFFETPLKTMYAAGVAATVLSAVITFSSVIGFNNCRSSAVEAGSCDGKKSGLETAATLLAFTGIPTGIATGGILMRARRNRV